MSYRLYTKDVEDELVDFNDLRYHMLKTVKDYSLIFNESTDRFIVAYKVQYHKLDSIDWVKGHYFDDVLEATEFFNDKVMDIRRLLHVAPSLSDSTLNVVLETMLEAREDGNIPDCSLERMMDLTISFIRDDPDIFEEGVVEELEKLLSK